MIINNSTHYGIVAKLLHWGMAICIFGMFIVGYVMTNIPKSSLRSFLFDMHKATGLVLLCLVLIRIIWRFINIQPDFSQSTPGVIKYLAHGNIFISYLMMLSMPISGFLISTLGGHDVSFYYLFTITPLANDQTASHYSGNVHEIAGYSFIVILILHVMGALYHQFKLKDNLLKRMC